MIEENFKDSYTIGFHVSEVAGQTVMRCHCHVIPRYVGEVQEPGGRVRGGYANRLRNHLMKLPDEKNLPETMEDLIR
jgi:diadenosine tetraphosphate (Ap4A) HIT family hydrolase